MRSSAKGDLAWYRFPNPFYAHRCCCVMHNYESLKFMYLQIKICQSLEELESYS